MTYCMTMVLALHKVGHPARCHGRVCPATCFLMYCFRVVDDFGGDLFFDQDALSMPFVRGCFLYAFYFLGRVHLGFTKAFLFWPLVAM